LQLHAVDLREEPADRGVVVRRVRLGRAQQQNLALEPGDPRERRSQFRVVGGGVLPADEAGQVQSGTLEQSNVDPTAVLVEMVEAQRLFEIRTKTVATAREIDESSMSLMRLT